MSDLANEIGPTTEAILKANKRITPESAEEVRHLTLQVLDPAFQPDADPPAGPFPQHVNGLTKPRDGGEQLLGREGGGNRAGGPGPDRSEL